jgi:hypothetical protein
MKKILSLLMLLVSLASANAKCDWSKVSLGKSNTCNAYKFEVTGTVDTCNKHSILIVKKGSTTPLYTGDNRIFSYTFKDTGYYFVKVSIKNRCCGGDTLFYDYIHVTCKPTTTPKCNWSSLRLQQWNNRNSYRWYVSGRALDDTCVNWMFMVYNVQTKKTDTVSNNQGICDVQFNKKGKYKMYLKVWNRCLKCDTTMMREVNLIYFPKCTFTYGLKSSTGMGCADSMVGEMTLGPWTKGDTCWQWYSYIWNGPMLDSLSQHDWDSMSNDQLYMYYDFNDSDLIWQKGPGNDARRVALKFPHDGHYLIATQWYNKCLDQDTFFFTRITIETCMASGIKTIIKGEPKVIGMYDMMGRPVHNARENEITIYLYSDGSTRKVIKK